MKILFYSREKCKYGMTLVTDDEVLWGIFHKRYDCRDIEATDTDIGGDFGALAQSIFDYIQKNFQKKTLLYYYKNNSGKALMWNPEENEKKEVACDEQSELSPIHLLENFLYTTLIPTDDVIALHGAAVAKSGKAQLLLASTMGGKSTLTAFLWKEGYEYITDDEIFISRSTMRLVPVRKNLSLRQGGYEMLGGNFKKVHNIYDGKTKTYLVVPENQLKYESYEIEKVVFLAGYGSDEPYFVKLEPRDAFLRLLKGQLSSKNSEGNVSEKYNIMANLAKISYEMRYSDLWTAEKFLKHSQK